MNMYRKAAIYIFFLISIPNIAVCNDLEDAAQAVHDRAESCMLEVRDQHIKYELSKTCMSLGDLSMKYIEAGGAKKGEPPESALIFANARVLAWMARAISESEFSPMYIW